MRQLQKQTYKTSVCKHGIHCHPSLCVCVCVAPSESVCPEQSPRPQVSFLYGETEVQFNLLEESISLFFDGLRVRQQLVDNEWLLITSVTVVF